MLALMEAVLVLCGGRGTRLREHTETIPKPLVEIGGRPILWHVIQIYAAQGFRRFVLCTGHRGELIERFAAGERWPDGVTVECAPTGEETPTGGRVKLVEDRVEGETFLVTYADGVADIDLGAQARFHREHGGAATMTLVRPVLQWGVAELDGGTRVAGFHEKPRSEHWINGGFFRFERRVFEYLDERSALERGPLERLAADGELHGYRHPGFWECMDTYKDAVELNDLWALGRAPWRLWD
jgi:glucose-1-phosphate cytidylyltransferase